MNRENLQKLANYLLSGELKAEFDMDNFTNKEWNSRTCGTVGCAVGHGPYAGMPKTTTEDWSEYSDRAFGILSANDWDWCFSHYWSQIDNTPGGAAKRILVLLEHGTPKAFGEQNFSTELY